MIVCRSSKKLATLVFAIASAVAIKFGEARAASYTFINIVDGNSPLGQFFTTPLQSSRPEINNDGTVAFWARRDAGGSGIYTGNGGPITTIADTTGEFASLSTAPSINDSGSVAFAARWDGGTGEGVYTGSGGPLTKIADHTGPLNNFELDRVAINASGTVAFSADRDSGGNEVIYTGSGGPLTLVAEQTGSLSTYFFFYAADINASGQAVFRAEQIAANKQIHFGSGGPLTSVAERTGQLSYLQEPSINDSGTVLYWASRPEGGDAIYAFSGGVTSTIAIANPSALSTAPFRSFNEPGGFNPSGYPKINNQGMITFSATRRDGSGGIFIGPDPINDALLLVGDPLFGSTVTFAGFSNLNDRGDVVFGYFLSNGVGGIAVAMLVPEPTTAMLAMLAFSTSTAFARRRHHRRP